MEEHKTRAKVAEALAGTSLAIWEPLLGTDLVADLPGGGNGRVLLRADMDALPIREETNAEWRSKYEGVMHACGHDGHTAILTGTALVLDAMKECLNSSVRFVFQPGEELVCAGKDLVERGVMDGVDAAFALHAWPGIPEAAIGCRPGPMFAAADHFAATFRGRGAHGAMPETGNNPIPPAAEFALGLQELHYRENPKDGSVISVCCFHAGNSSNIIPENAEVEGTLRYLNVERGDELVGAITELARSSASRSGIEVETKHERTYSLPVVNSERGFSIVRDLAAKYLGPERFAELEKPSMGAEDFAFYLDGREGAMFRLGMGEGSPGVHTPRFDFNDEALGTGILMLSLIALEY